MGLFSKVKKALKKVTKIADPAGLTGGGKDGKAASVDTPAATTAAVTVEAPKTDAQTADTADTEANKKAASSRGKRNLQVTRAAGTGVNI